MLEITIEIILVCSIVLASLGLFLYGFSNVLFHFQRKKKEREVLYTLGKALASKQYTQNIQNFRMKNNYRCEQCGRFFWNTCEETGAIQSPDDIACQAFELYATATIESLKEP